MERITHSTRVIDANGSGRDGYGEGTPGVTPATVVPAAALNSFQEEIVRSIELLGGTPSGADNAQLGTLLVALRDARVVGPASATDNAIARFDLATGKLIQNSGATVDDSANLVTTGEYTYASAKTRTMIIPGVGFGIEASSAWTHNDNHIMCDVAANAGAAKLDLSFLPDGAQITHLKALVTPGGARASGSRMKLELISRTYDFTTPGTGSASVLYTAEDNGGTSLQVITLDASGSPVAINKSGGKTLVAKIQSGNGTGTDLFHALQITFTDPGPRNY